ncbi:MAG: hypothetical protein NTZ67_02555 [Gammaproteobacteria bacterium]|nr:hypothetical protein [Gammaproteobacteria bacterium]
MIYKNFIMLIALSVAAIFFQTQLMHVLQFLMYVHAQLAKGLGVIFSLNAVGEVVQSVLALILIPVVLAIIVGVAHFFIRQHHFPHPMTLIWVCWAVLLASVLSQTGRVSDHPTDHCRPIVQQTDVQNSKAPDMKNPQDMKNAQDEKVTPMQTTPAATPLTK